LSARKVESEIEDASVVNEDYIQTDMSQIII